MGARTRGITHLRRMRTANGRSTLIPPKCEIHPQLGRWALVGTDTGYQVRAYNDNLGTSTDVVTWTGPPAAVQISRR